MDIELHWKSLCRAFHIRDWDTLEVLLEQFQQRLDAGEAPVISEDVSNGFNHAMATAGVAFIRSHFSRTDEWPVVDADYSSLRDTATSHDPDHPAPADESAG